MNQGIKTIDRIYRRDKFGQIYIEDEGAIRRMHFGSDLEQSAIFTRAPHVLVQNYTQALVSALALVQRPERILILGLGGGCLATYLHHYYRQLDVVVVEQRQTVISLAYEYFFLPRSRRLSVVEMDAANYVDTDRFDVIITDLFDAKGMSTMQSDKEMIQYWLSMLNRNGILAMNLQGNVGPIIDQALLETEFHCHPSFSVDSNQIVFITSQHKSWQRKGRIQQAQRLPSPLATRIAIKFWQGFAS